MTVSWLLVICNIAGAQEVRGISLYQALRGWKLGTVVQNHCADSLIIFVYPPNYHIYCISKAGPLPTMINYYNFNIMYIHLALNSPNK